MEYLKNVVLRYILSSSVAERKRLLPVIGQVIKFTDDETARALRHVQDEVDPLNVTRNFLSGMLS